MKITIFGMGYVGLVSGACLLRDGHEVIGVDTVVEKISDLRKGLVFITIKLDQQGSES